MFFSQHSYFSDNRIQFNEIAQFDRCKSVGSGPRGQIFENYKNILESVGHAFRNTAKPGCCERV